MTELADVSKVALAVLDIVYEGSVLGGRVKIGEDDREWLHRAAVLLEELAAEVKQQKVRLDDWEDSFGIVYGTPEPLPEDVVAAMREVKRLSEERER